MASFEEHIQQAESNLAFLGAVNQKINNYFDWQVTICFYTALHLVNAHLSRHQLQYRKHYDVNYALNPDVRFSVSKLPEDEYDAYIALQRLSRRSRYLVNEKDGQLKNEIAFFTFDKHLCKAIRHLDRLLVFFAGKYDLNFLSTPFKCLGLSENDRLNHFKIAA